MTNVECRINDEVRKSETEASDTAHVLGRFVIWVSGFFRHSAFVIRPPTICTKLANAYLSMEE